MEENVSRTMKGQERDFTNNFKKPKQPKVQHVLSKHHQHTHICILDTFTQQTHYLPLRNGERSHLVIMDCYILMSFKVAYNRTRENLPMFD